METPNLLLLVNKIRQLEGVIQVRFHQVLKPRFVNLLGKDGVSIICLVKNKADKNKYIRIVTLLKAEVIENVEMHDSIVEDVKTRVEDYTIRNIKPTRFANANRSTD